MAGKSDKQPTKKRRRGPGRPFKKGQSGNPSGRPRIAAEVRDLARQHTTEAIERLVQLMRSDDERVAKAACDSILDRAVGKPSQAITGEDGGPVRLDLDRLSDGKLRTLAAILEDASVSST